jgi:quercetin 2,3-dioxygenase
MGNKEVLKRGEVQFTSAGTGIRHSEYNADARKPLRFLQVWVAPSARGLKPRYDTRMFKDEEKRNTLKKILSSDGADGSIQINQDCTVYASLLEDGKTVSHKFANEGRRGYLHVPKMEGTKSLTVKGLKSGTTADLAPGDGLFIEGEDHVEITAFATAEGAKAAEFIFFDLA